MLQIPILQSLVVWKCFTIKQPYMHIQAFKCHNTCTHVTLQKRIWKYCHRLPRQACGSSFQDILWDVAEGPRWALKQRGISINKGTFNSLALLKECTAMLGIMITCDPWFMNGVDTFTDVCCSRFLSPAADVRNMKQPPLETDLILDSSCVSPVLVSSPLCRIIVHTTAWSIYCIFLQKLVFK